MKRKRMFRTILEDTVEGEKRKEEAEGNLQH